MAMSFNMLSTTSASKKLVRKGVLSPDDNKSLYSLVIYYVTNTYLLSFNNLLITPLNAQDCVNVLTSQGALEFKKESLKDKML